MERNLDKTRETVNFMLKGKTILITGASSGIGLQTALALARQGAEVVMVGHDPERSKDALERVKTESRNDSVSLLTADLSDLHSVRQLAEDFKASHSRLDVLVNNAGGIFKGGARTPDGLEYSFAVNHLGHFLLTTLLLDQLKASTPARSVNVSSAAHHMGRDRVEKLRTGTGRAGGWQAYCDSKLENALFTMELARRLEGTRVTANCLHPGVVRTRFGKSGSALVPLGFLLIYPFTINSDQGAQTSIYLASSPDVEEVSGKYFVRKRVSTASRLAQDPELAKRLWEFSEELIIPLRT